MTCRELSSWIESRLVGDPPVVPWDDESVREHLERCARCAGEWGGVWPVVEALERGDSDPHVSRLATEARERLRLAFGRIGRPAVRYDWLATPIGRVFVGLSDRGVYDVALDVRDEAGYRRRLEGRTAELYRDRTGVEPALAELDAYFSGRRRSFSVATDLRSVSAFTRRVLEAARRIPFGSVQRYGDLARTIGSPRASRAVGQALGRNPVPVVIPCHRVVAGGGRLGGFTGGVETKRRLLAHEGHAVTRSTASGLRLQTEDSRSSQPATGRRVEDGPA